MASSARSEYQECLDQAHALLLAARLAPTPRRG